MYLYIYFYHIHIIILSLYLYIYTYIYIYIYIQIVYHKDANQYFWALDLEFGSELCGPYPSIDTCVTTAISTAPDQLIFNTIPFKVQVVDVIVCKDLMVKVFKRLIVIGQGGGSATSEAGVEGVEEYFFRLVYSACNSSVCSIHECERCMLHYICRYILTYTIYVCLLIS